MLKKLVALTLVAIMIINPMTAMAVSWSDVKTQVLAARNTKHSFDDGDIVAEVDDEGNVKVVGNNGSIDNFFHSDDFKSYTFEGTIHFNGEKFEIYVKKNDDGSSNRVLVDMDADVAIHANKVDVQAEDGSTLEMGGDAFHVYTGGDQQTIVMVGDNVLVTSDVSFHAGENSSITVTIDGDINNVGAMRQKYDEYGPVVDENGNPVLEPVNVDMGASENASLTATLNGEIKTEDVHTRVDGTSNVNITNNGDIFAQNQIGIYAGENSDGTISFTNNGDLNVNVNTDDDIYDEDVEENYIGGVMIGSWENTSEMTFTNTAAGVVNGNVSGWLDNTMAGASTTVTNEGELNGDVGVWGNGGEGAIKLENSGTVEGNLGTNSHDDISLDLSNSGKVEGEMFADNQSSKDMTVTNSGDTNGLSVGNANAENVTVINSGNVTGGETHIDGGAGNVTFENTGSIEGERFDLHAHTNGTVTGTNSGTIDVEWGYVGSSENGNVTFTNESDGSIHTDENFDIAAGKWNGEEDYEYNPENSSTTSFVNKGEIVTEGSFHGNLQENGSITLENTKTGTMTAVNNGIHVGINDNGHGSVSVNNAGTVNSEWFNVGSETTGTASITNTGTVNGYMGAYADGAYDDNGNLIEANKDGVVSITNSGTVNGGMDSYVNGGGTGTVVNNGTAINVNANAEGEGASVNLTNDGTAEFVHVGAYEGATGTAVNTGTVTGELQNTAGNGGSSSAINNGTTNGMWSHADEGGSVSSTNNSSANNQGGYSESDDSSVTIMNNGTVEGWLEGYMFGNGSAEVVNNGNVGIKVSGVAGGEGSVTAVNTSDGTIGDGVQNEDNPPDGLWVSAENGGTAAAINDGTINGEIGGGAYGEGSVADVVNTENGAADTSWLDVHGGNVALNNEGTVSGTLSVSIGTQGNAVTDETTVAQLLKQTGIDISGYENVDIYTANPDGELIARYSVDENGEVTLEEVLMEEDNGSDDPRFWTDERIRHHKEMERKAAAIGGVTGSPYWVKSLYLGYMSLNLRLFDGEEQLLFKENLSWVPGTGVAGEKVLTLNVKTEDTSALAMRLDGMVINKLEQAGIVTINIVDGAGNLFMEYKVEDLKGARELYGLTEKEYIVVGAADADVMKIAEDGTISPIEGEEEPAEEVAEEAKAETETEAAEETPAA